MVTFVDTSAIYSYLDLAERNHARARATFLDLLKSGERLTTHNYVALECAALVQRRLGVDATRALLNDVLPLIDVVWIDEQVHQLAVASLLGSGQRNVSLVDWASFVVMRQRRIEQAFAFDSDFEAQGLAVIPG